MQVRLYNNGVCLKMLDADRKKIGGGKRGKCSGKFSSSSFRRLREFCITHDCNGDCYGITLTIPGLSIVHWLYVKDYIHLLSVWCNGRKIPMIWRCELQQRGQPHLHLVVYCDIRQCLEICLQWQKYIMRCGRCLSAEFVAENVKEFVWVNRMFVEGSFHAFDVQKLSGDFRSWRYLVAHQSKGKQAQSGWNGRQWGIVNKACFDLTNALQIDLTDDQMFKLRRFVRRLTRRKINTIGKHFLLCNPDTVQKLVNFLLDQTESPF